MNRDALPRIPVAEPCPESVDPYEVFRRPTVEVDMSEVRKRMMDTIPPPPNQDTILHGSFCSIPWPHVGECKL